MAWQDSFAQKYWTDAFLATAGRSSPHRGTDLAYLTLYAWEELTVENSDLFYTALGNCVTLRAKDGTRFGVAHCRRGTRAANGKVLKPGDVIALAAMGPKSLSQSNANFPGTQWVGAHFHITMTNGADPFSGDYNVLRDARPRIISGGGGGGGGAVNYGFGLTTEAQREIQRALTKLGLYSGDIDGVFGPKSVEGFQRFLKSINLLSSGYLVDGIPGKVYGRAAQVLAQSFGYVGPLDGLPGSDTSSALVKWSMSIMGGGPTTPPVVPPPVVVVPPVWEKIYPKSDAVVSSPNRELRKTGSVVGYLILHGTANPVDHTAYFQRRNERQVAPNNYLRPSGEIKEMVRFSERAWTTGVPLDHQAITFEIESDNTTYTDAQYEEIAQYAAWLSQQTKVDGIPVDFKITRQNILGHREVPGVTSGTSCPGALDIDRIVRRALEIVKPIEVVSIPKEVLERWLAESKQSSSISLNLAEDIKKVLV